MIKNKRSFNTSFLISFVWHMAIISMVTVVVTPNVSKLNIYQEVNFLGPILEKTAFELMAGETRSGSETLYSHSPVAIDRFSLKVKGPSRKTVDKVFPMFLEERFSFSLKKYFAGVKEVPGYFFEESFAQPVKIHDEKKGRIQLGGSVTSRRILYRPELPKVPRALYGDNKEFVVRLKFYVSNDGRVEAVEPLISSGSAEVDLACMRYLKLWQFSPVSVIKSEKIDLGEVSLRLAAE